MSGPPPIGPNPGGGVAGPAGGQQVASAGGARGASAASTRKGRFTDEEKAILQQTIADYVISNDVAGSFEEGIQILCNKTRDKALRGAWVQIAKCLPGRTVPQVYSFCIRAFSPQQRGKWTQEEIVRLKELVAQHGPVWSKIGKELGRFETSCRDKYRLVKDEFLTGAWTVEEDEKLRKLVQEHRALNNTKDAAGNEVILWTEISAKLKTRSHSACRNRWYNQLLPEIAPPQWSSEHDEEMIRNIAAQKVLSEHSIKWSKVSRRWTGREAKRRFKQLCAEHNLDSEGNLASALSSLMQIYPRSAQPDPNPRASSAAASLMGGGSDGGSADDEDPDDDDDSDSDGRDEDEDDDHHHAVAAAAAAHHHHAVAAAHHHHAVAAAHHHHAVAAAAAHHHHHHHHHHPGALGAGPLGAGPGHDELGGPDYDGGDDGLRSGVKGRGPSVRTTNMLGAIKAVSAAAYPGGILLPVAPAAGAPPQGPVYIPSMNEVVARASAAAEEAEFGKLGVPPGLDPKNRKRKSPDPDADVVAAAAAAGASLDMPQPSGPLDDLHLHQRPAKLYKPAAELAADVAAASVRGPGNAAAAAAAAAVDESSEMRRRLAQHVNSTPNAALLRVTQSREQHLAAHRALHRKLQQQQQQQQQQPPPPHLHARR